MIIFKKLSWSNAFSYGSNNSIDFDQVPLLQLVGKNGHGKTSIILVLEEVLFNKNSKGIARAKVLNRYTKEKSYSISLEFEKDGVSYLIETKRGSTQTVKLLENSVDISAHTATGTYKLIEDILGMDHKTFAQIVNQLSSSSLEFLTATDSNRKKFLIDLLNLEKYGKGADIFKASAKAIDTELTKVQAKVSSLQDLIKRNKASNPTLLEEVEIPASLFNPEELQELEFKLRNIAADNKAILQNNKYKEILDSLKIEVAGPKPTDNTTEITKSKTEAIKSSTDAAAFIKKMTSLGSKCPTCLSDIDKDKIGELVHSHRSIKEDADRLAKELEVELSNTKAELARWNSVCNNQKLYEEYHALYNPNLPVAISDPDIISAKVIKLKKLKQTEDAAKAEALAHNAKVATNNAKVTVILEQTKELEAELPPLLEQTQSLQNRLANLQVLVKTFSNTGLVAYKIECLVKDLENLTNEYLNDLSGGRFQIAFEIASSDKLNVVINDNGNDIEITALSGGEKARVNVATLLGIRKLLQSLSNNRVNLLFLDETIDSLDDDGKEKLVEILLNEEYLNTVIVSHGFQHPLIEKLRIIKTNNISRIEHG